MAKTKTKKLSDYTVADYNYLLNTTNISHYFLIGSRKSAKTKHVVLRIVKRILEDPEYNAVCFRKVNKTIWDSIKAEIDGAINLLGVERFFVYNGTRQEYTYLPNKTLIKLRSIETDTASGKTKVSGLNVVHGGIKDAWFEEAYEFTYADYVMVTGTMRGGFYSIIFSANPGVATNWLVAGAQRLLPQRFAVMKAKGQQFKYLPLEEEGRGVIVHWTNGYMNTKIDPADKLERLAELRRDPKRYYTTGYGMAGAPDGTILGDLLDHVQYSTFEDAVKHISVLKGGVDYGLVNDATTAVIGGYTAGYQDMIMLDEYYHSNGDQTYNKGPGQRYDINDYVREIVEFYEQYIELIRGKGIISVEVDNSEHGFIQLLNKEANRKGVSQGIKFNPCYKPKIEDRVIFERALLSMDKVGFVEKEMPLLYAELENLRGKMNKKNKPERDEASYSNHVTDAGEYFFSRLMYKMIPQLSGKGE